MSEHLLSGVALMIVAYAFLLVIVGSALCINDCKSDFARMLDWYIERELGSMERMYLKITNCYWLIRCLFLKRWWQCRRDFTLSSNYGMSWEGKEKEYHKRYALTKVPTHAGLDIK